VYNPGQLAIDPYNNLFFPTETGGAALSTIQPTPATFANFYDPFAYNETGIAAFTVDSSDNLYSVWDSSKTCEIVEQPFYDAANFLMFVNKVAGGRACGFSGDGGRAGNAEIGASIGQMTFDLAGNLYFSDTSNNRIRRIDGATGVIRTIAGNGTTAATLTAPTGVSVDSRGQVYILSGSSGSLQVVRKVGINGALTFPGQVQNTSSTALIVTLANTGNAGLSLSKSLMTGANSADFTIDPVSSTCDFTPGNTLSVGFSCALGIIFKPSALGARAATLKIYDNTLSGANYINLKGTGSAAAALKITAPVAHAQLPAGTPATFSVSATSSSGPAPTGTVTFKTDAKQMGKPVTIIAGAASTKLSGLPAGTHIISAHYNVDARNAAATATETITITP
jgi:hypothetical protein